MMKYEKFEDLPIWKLSVEIAKSIYNLTSNDSFKGEYSLVNQVRNSVLMVNSYIVEGFENYKEFPKFLMNAKSYVQRLRSQLYICHEVGLLQSSAFQEVSAKLDDLFNQVGGLVYYLRKPKKEKVNDSAE